MLVYSKKNDIYGMEQKMMEGFIKLYEIYTSISYFEENPPGCWFCSDKTKDFHAYQLNHSLLLSTGGGRWDV